jgi:hypothetical protein
MHGAAYLSLFAEARKLMGLINNINTQSLSGDKMGDRFLILILLLITMVHFSIPVIATWDTAHYHNYLEILYGKKSWDNWDVIRGPVFPVLTGMILWAYIARCIAPTSKHLRKPVRSPEVR